MKKIKKCCCGGLAKLRKYICSYAVVCPDCGCRGEQIYLDEEHSLCETQNLAIEARNGK